MIDITPLIWVASKLTLNLPNSNSEIVGTFVHHHCCFTLALKPDILIFVFIFASDFIFVFAFVFSLYCTLLCQVSLI